MRRRMLGGLLVVLVTGCLLGSTGAATFARAGARTYPGSLSGATWIQPPGGERTAYFLLPLNLPVAPELATLWIGADQQYQVYANGLSIAHNQPPAKFGQPPLADPVDLSWRLHKGSNGIGIEVSNDDGDPAALIARLTLDFGDKVVTYTTSPGTWLATSRVQQVRYPGANTKSAQFSSAAFDAGQWPYAVRATSARPQLQSLAPAAILAGPLTGKVISAGASRDMLASSAIGVPAGSKDAWLRVIASDAYSLSVDGQLVASQPTAYFPAGQGTGRRAEAAVDVYDIHPYLRAGPNPILVHVYGSRPAAIYLDGAVDGSAGPVHMATGPGWRAASSASDTAGQAAGKPAVVLGPVSKVWPNGVRRTGVTPDLTLQTSTDATGQTRALPAPLPGVPSAVSFEYTVTGMVLAVLLWLAAGTVTALAAARRLGRALCVDAAGHLPALAAAGAVAALARLPNWVPPWPYTSAIFWVLIAIFAAGKLSTLCACAPTGWLSLRRLKALTRRSPARLTPLTRLPPVGRHRPGVPLVARVTPTAEVLFPLRLAMARAFTQFGEGAVRLDGETGWRAAELPWLRRLRALGRLTAGIRGLSSHVVSGLGWTNGAVIAVALATTTQLTYGLGYEPYSGDETVSLLAAHSIRDRLVPRFPSGLLYLKGELYHYPLAALTAVFGDNPVPLRLFTVLTYGATVLAFGLLLLPIVLPGHPVARVTLTLLFATAPVELQEAQLVRMYQQEQLFAVLFVAFFLLALRASRVAAGLEQPHPEPAGRLWALATRWSIPLSAVTLIAMYLSLEESFILLPAVPVVLLGGLRLRWLRDRQWLRWGLPAVAVIGIQYWLTLTVKMPALGFDSSNKPYVYYDPSDIYYYLARYLLAIPGGRGGVAIGSGYGTLYLITSLAVLAGAVGLARRDFGRLYLSAFLWLPVIVLSTLFSAHAERYLFILLPMLFALAGLGTLDVLGWLRTLLTATSEARERRLISGLIMAAAVPGFVWLAGSIPARAQDYGLTLSRLADIPYAQQQSDYTTVPSYMRAREKPGDLFIILASITQSAYYAGRPADMVIQPHPNKFLFLTEKDGIVVEDYFGSPVILTASDLEQVIASHHRIWLMTDQGRYFATVPTDMTALIRAQFTEVAQGQQSALYFKGS